MRPACCAMLILANVVLVSLKCERIYIWKKPRDLNFFLLFWVFSNCWLLVVSFLIMGSVISRSRKKIKNKTVGLLRLYFLLPPVWRQKKNFAVHVKSANENIENCQLWFVFFGKLSLPQGALNFCNPLFDLNGSKLKKITSGRTLPSCSIVFHKPNASSHCLLTLHVVMALLYLFSKFNFQQQNISHKCEQHFFLSFWNW